MDAVLAYYYRSGPPVGLFVLIFLVIGSIALIGWYFSKGNRLKRRLRAAKPWPIAELPEDTLGKITGQARVLGGTLVGPLTGRTCVFYVATVQERRSSGRSTYWRTIITETAGVPFMLEDGSGRALVDPTGAEVALDFDGNSSSGTFHDADLRQEAFLAKHGQKSTGWVFNKGLRYREAMIEVGETIAVMGSGVREPDPEAPPEEAYRGAPKTRLRLTSSARYPLVISDASDVVQ
jgi:hypothetical protein